MKIFLDFDDVLFDTKEFRATFKDFLVRHDVDPDLYQQTREQSYSEASFESGSLYDIKRHMEAIHALSPKLDVQKILGEVDVFLQHIEPYVFPDVRDFLMSFSKRDLSIISYGEEVFQRKKIIGSGVDKFVQDVQVVQGSKLEVFRSLPQVEERVFFLDDRSGYMHDIKKACSHVQTILVSRPEGRYHDERTEWCDFKVTNLDDAKEIILNTKN